MRISILIYIDIGLDSNPLSRCAGFTCDVPMNAGGEYRNERCPEIEYSLFFSFSDRGKRSRSKVKFNLQNHEPSYNFQVTPNTMLPADLESGGGVPQNEMREQVPMVGFSIFLLTSINLIKHIQHDLNRPSSKQQQTPNFSRPSTSLAPQETGITNGDIISPIHEQSEYTKVQHEQYDPNGIPPDIPPPTTSSGRVMGVSWADHRRQFWYGVSILAFMIVITVVIIKVVIITNHNRDWDGPVNIQPAVTLLPALPSLTDDRWVPLPTGL
jgi:hypothetical protein